MKQKTFTFKYQHVDNFELNSKPPYCLTWADYVKSRLNKKGWLVKNLKEETVIRVSCYTSRANISKAEREKMQKQIDDMPPQNVFYIRKP